MVDALVVRDVGLDSADPPKPGHRMALTRARFVHSHACSARILDVESLWLLPKFAVAGFFGRSGGCVLNAQGASFFADLG